MTLTFDTAARMFENAAHDLADAEDRRARNEIEKAEYEAALVNSLLGTTNVETNKPHSATSAAAAASKDPRTVEYREERIKLERAVTLAKVAYKIAEMRAWMVVHTAGRVEVPAA